MQLQLQRTLYPNGTNGQLFCNGKLVCYTIELPWLNNQPQHSCIPVGNYKLTWRFSKKFGTHLLVNDVPGRSLILIHPANDALKELKGCIAPVTRLTGEGTGIGSRAALRVLTNLLLSTNEPMEIQITQNPKLKTQNSKHKT